MPFLLYAAVRFLQADVRLDAERSFLLFLTPFLVGVHVLFGLDRERRRSLYVLIMADLFLLGVYGLVNHALTGSRVVLWANGRPGYYLANRASGSYFCPDHFAGILEIALAMSLGFALSSRVRSSQRGPALALGAVAVAGVVLSKSRGGGLTVLVVMFAALFWGFADWPEDKRWWNRLSGLTALAIVMLIFAHSNHPYMQRFRGYLAPDSEKDRPVAETVSVLMEKARHTSRGKMFSGALRAWKTEKTFGIGPGMHRNLWPRFAASPDGDREGGLWPSMLNNHFHSYEVHSDWIQLLEEYGLVGLILLLIPFVALCGVLLRGLHRQSRVRVSRRHRFPADDRTALILGGFLALTAMSFHSLGDFNLQMPATTWMLAAVVSIALSAAFEAQPVRARRQAR